MRDGDSFFGAWVEDVRDYAILSLDPQGHVASWNAGAERILGYRAADVLGRYFGFLFTPEDVDGCVPERELAQATAGGQAADDRWHLRRDGQRFWCNGLLTRVVDGDGALRGFVKMMRDLTGPKYLEDELRRQARKLEESESRREEFLARLIRELGPPLDAILAALRRFRDQPSADGAPGGEAHAAIEAQVLRLSLMADNLRGIAGSPGKGSDVRRERVPLAGVLEPCIEEARPLMEARGHAFVVSVDGAGGIRLDADPARLGQVVRILLDNAARYTAPGGRVELRARREGSEVVLRIADDGPGLRPEMLARLFTPQALRPSAGVTPASGLGIGLPLARRLVEKQGGSIEARSDGPGRGSEFLVRLPIAAEPDEAVPPFRVLLVEDNPVTATTLGLLLRSAGYEYASAEDGPSAIARIEAHPPDVILTDIGLPGMSGYDFVEAVRRLGIRVPVVAMSGYPRDGSRGVEFDHYLIKPVDPDDLLDVLDELRRARR